MQRRRRQEAEAKAAAERAIAEEQRREAMSVAAEAMRQAQGRPDAKVVISPLVQVTVCVSSLSSHGRKE